MMTTWPFTLIGEILVDGVWQEVSLLSSDVSITRGFNSEGSEAEPGESRVTIDNRDGRYSPRNPESPLYGKIGRNTPFRLRVDDLPAEPTPILSDNFTRTVTAGWGTANTGQAWTIYDPYSHSPGATEYQVNGSKGLIHIDVSTGIQARFISTNVNMDDVDIRYQFYATQQARDPRSDFQIASGVLTRLNTSNTTGYFFNIGLRTDTGLPGSKGLRVALDILELTGTNLTLLTPRVNVPGVTYEPNVPLNVRIQSIGSEHRVKVWMDGSPEPSAWHSQGYSELYPSSGTVAMFAQKTATDTTVPFDVAFDNLTISDPTPETGVVRMSGEIPAWPPTRNLTSSYIVSSVKPAGILRRLGQGKKPVKSFMRKYLPTYFPPAYWAMEEGIQGNTYVADTTVDNNTGPMRVSGLEFSKGDVVGSEGSLPLAQVVSSATMRSPIIQSEQTPYWSVDMMVRLDTDKWPTDANQHQILRFLTSGSNAYEWIVTIQLSAGTHQVRLTVNDSNGTQLGTITATHEGGAGSGVPLLDQWVHLLVNVSESGTTLNYQFKWQNAEGGNWGNSSTLATTSAGKVKEINTVFGSGATGMFLGHVSVWGIRDTEFYLSPGMMRGFNNQSTRKYLILLSNLDDVPVTLYGPALERLGPALTGTFLNSLSSAVDTEMGLLTELRGDLGLQYKSLDTLYNRPVELTLDWSNGEIFDPLNMTDDDKFIKNRVTAKRREGSEYTASIDVGPLSTQEYPDGIGLYDTQADTIVYSDDQLADQASWRLHVASVDEMRITSLTLKMANPRMAPLVDQVLLLDAGSRVQVVNVPSDLPPDGFDLMVMGYEETIRPGVWDITFNCVPYSPYIVGEADSETRADSDNSTLGASASSSATSLSVAIASGAQRWIDSATYSSQFPLDILVGGERMTVTAISGTSSPQTFTVIRSINGVVKSHTSGTKVSLFQPYYVAL